MGLLVDGNFYEAAAERRAPPARGDSSSCVARPLDKYHHREAFIEGVERRHLHGLSESDAGANADGRTKGAAFMPQQQPVPHPMVTTFHQEQHHRPAGSFERSAEVERENLVHTGHSRRGWEHHSADFSDSSDGGPIHRRGVESLGGQRRFDPSQEQQSSSGVGASSMSISFRQSSLRSSSQQQQQQQTFPRGIVGEGIFGVDRAQQPQYEERASEPLSSFAAGMPDSTQPQRFGGGRGGGGRGGGDRWNTHSLSSPSSSSSQERALAAAAYPRNGPARSRATYPRIDASSSSSSSSFGSHPDRMAHASSFRPPSGLEYDDVHERRRAALATAPSLPNMSCLLAPPQHSSVRGVGGRSQPNELQLATAAHPRQRHGEARPDHFGRRQEFVHGGGNGVTTGPFSTRSSGGYPAEGFDNRLGQQQLQLQQEHSETFRGSSLDVTQQQSVAVQDAIRHQEPTINRFAGSYSSGGGGNPNSGAAGALGRCKSFNGIATAEQPRVDGRIAADDGDNRQFGGGGGELNPPTSSRSPPFAPSPSAAAAAKMISTPKNPLEWLQNLNLRQSRNGNGNAGVDDRGATPPRASRSDSGSPLVSNSRTSAASGGDSGGGSISTSASDVAGVAGRADSLLPRGQSKPPSPAAAAGPCPAPDCTASGDCVPGATPEMLVYEVNFKRATRTFLPGDKLNHDCIACGALMIVEADRGEDLGTVHRSLPLSEYLHALDEEKKAKAAKIAENGGGGGSAGDGSESKKKRNKSKKAEEDGEKNGSKQQQQQQQQRKKQEEQPEEESCPVRAIKRILRPANATELQQLREKTQQEAGILRVCQNKVRHRSLPMKIVDAEYQFDMHKLTLFFEAERRIDFRELVRDLFAVYKTRIWMQQVKDKNTTSPSGVSAAASVAASVAASIAAPAPTPAPAPASTTPDHENGNVAEQAEEGATHPAPSLVDNRSSDSLVASLDMDHGDSGGSGDDKGGGIGWSSGSGHGGNLERGFLDSQAPWTSKDIAVGCGDSGNSDGSERAAAMGAGWQQQQQQQQQQQPAFSLAPDVFFDVGGILDAKGANPPHQQQHHPDHHQQHHRHHHHHHHHQAAPSYLDLPQGLDFLSLA